MGDKGLDERLREFMAAEGGDPAWGNTAEAVASP
jgi:hypothetical protein